MPTGDPSSEGRLKKLEWYKETVQWLVVVSACAVLLGLDWLSKYQMSSRSKVFLTITASLLLLSCAAGVLAIFKIADYAESEAASHRTGANRWFWMSFALMFTGLTMLVGLGMYLIWQPSVQ
jgi:hypothetical protein